MTTATITPPLLPPWQWGWPALRRSNMSYTHAKVEEQHSPQLYGVIAEFSSSDALIAGARAVQEAGYTKYECYSPHPVHGIDQAMKTPYSPIPWLVLGGGLSGTFL